MTINHQLIKSIIKNDTSSPDELSQLKRNFSRKHKVKIPTNIILLKAYYSMIENSEIKKSAAIENLLKVRKVRSQSGVAVVAVLTKDFGCPGHCLYCPTEKGMPKSYLSNEPAVMRAILNKFNPYKQVKMRLEALENSGHPTGKIELIIIGGTFSAIPEKYRFWFIKRCYQAANTFAANYKFQITNPKQSSSSKFQTLKKAQRLNEKTRHRIVGITIETRPDYISEKEILKLRELGVTRVELGVQSIYDDVLKLNRRGHSVSQTIKATKLLKDAGFKINYHIMPNLPGATTNRDKKMSKEIFTNPDFQPDILKIYPTVVVKNSKLYKWWKSGKYKPYSDKQLLKLLIEIKKDIPPYVRIMRLVRDIPAQSIVAGSKISNLRQIIEQNSYQKNWRCRCIRCREIGKSTLRQAQGDINVKNLELRRIDYPASGGKEIFLSFEDVKADKLYALLRLRIPSHIIQRPGLGKLGGNKKYFIPALNNAAIIRELHTYGKTVPIAKKSKGAAQHTGLGKRLTAEAERIVREEFGLKKIAVISGVGVRDYYRKLGYRLKNEYMIKEL